MKNLEYFTKRAKIGLAVWLLSMYWTASDPDEQPWHKVLDGSPVADAEVAAFMNVSVYTATRWRKRLTRAGLIEAKACGEGFRIRVQRPGFAAGVRAVEGHLPAKEDWPKMATNFVQ